MPTSKKYTLSRRTLLRGAACGVGVGHLATEFDRAAFTSLVHDFGANGARVRGLLSAIVASDGFRYLPKAM